MQILYLVLGIIDGFEAFNKMHMVKNYCKLNKKYKFKIDFLDNERSVFYSNIYRISIYPKEVQNSRFL